MANNRFLKDPEAVLDYQFDWSEEWLEGGEPPERILTHVITVPPEMTLDKSEEADGKIAVWLSGGTAGENYKVACLVETSAGRTDERTIWIKVVNR
jgi:hypothetical protein